LATDLPIALRQAASSSTDYRFIALGQTGDWDFPWPNVVTLALANSGLSLARSCNDPVRVEIGIVYTWDHIGLAGPCTGTKDSPDQDFRQDFTANASARLAAKNPPVPQARNFTSVIDIGALRNSA